MNKGEEFIQYACDLMQTVLREEADNLERAAQAVKNTIVNDGMVYSFGTGHSVFCARKATGVRVGWPTAAPSWTRE